MAGEVLVLIGFTLLFFQGISELIKRIAVMRGLIPDPYATQSILRSGGRARRELEADTTS